MNKIIILSLFCFLPILVFTQIPTNDTHWQLKWEEQFNTLDTAKWYKCDYTDGSASVQYKYPQLYRKDHVGVSNGNLVIKLNNVEDTSPLNGLKFKYRSGKIETTAAYNTQFGYIEARIKLPFKRVNGKSWGFFPAFWTFVGNGVSGTNVAEIDIFEMFGGEYKEPNTLNTCIHRWYNNNNGDQSRSHTFSDFNYTSFHTYAIEWNKDRLVWYLDGNAIRTTTNHLIIDPVRIILNLAIQKESAYLPPTSPYFEEYMYVDYVKVYNLKCDKNTVVTQIPNFNTYNYAVKKSISLSNTTTIPAGSNITLRATDFIELKAGFEVPTGRTLYLYVTPCQ